MGMKQRLTLRGLRSFEETRKAMSLSCLLLLDSSAWLFNRCSKVAIEYLLWTQQVHPKEIASLIGATTIGIGSGCGLPPRCLLRAPPQLHVFRQQQHPQLHAQATAQNHAGMES